MALMDVFSRVVEGIGAAAIVLRGQDGRKVTQAFGANPAIPAAKPQGNIPTLKMPTAQGWSRGASAETRPWAQGQRLCDRSQAPSMDLRAAEWRRARSRGAFDAGTRKLALRLRHVQHAETGGGDGRQPQPHHAFARRRSRRRRRDEDHVPRAAQPAVRNGAGRRHVLRRQHGRRRRLSLHGGREQHHRARSQAHHAQRRRALDAQPAFVARQDEALYRGRLADQHRRQGHGGRKGPSRHS